jgi:hypothetical protein
MGAVEASKVASGRSVTAVAARAGQAAAMAAVAVERP